MDYLDLGDVCDVIKGTTGITKAIPGPFTMVTTGSHRITHNEYQFETEAVIIPLVSATGHGHASIKRIHYESGKFSIGSILAACIPKNNKEYSARFLYIYLSLMKDSVLVPLMKGSANVSLTINNLKTARIPNIDFIRQVEIVELYEKLKSEKDILSEELDNQNILVSKLKQAILQEAVQGKLTAHWRTSNPVVEPAGELLEWIKAEKERLVKEKKIKKEKPLPAITKDEIPYELPEGWVWCRLGDITTIKGGKRLPKGHCLITEDTGRVYIRVTDMKNGTINDSDLHYITEDVFKTISNYIIERDDLYLTIVGATIGKLGLIPEKFHGMNLTENAARIIKYRVNKVFLYNTMISDLIQKQFFDKTNQVGVPKLALHRVAKTYIPLPPLQEQKAIVEKVNSLMALCDRLEQEVKQSKVEVEMLMKGVLKEVVG